MASHASAKIACMIFFFKSDDHQMSSYIHIQIKYTLFFISTVNDKPTESSLIIFILSRQRHRYFKSVLNLSRIMPEQDPAPFRSGLLCSGTYLAESGTSRAMKNNVHFLLCNNYNKSDQSSFELPLRQLSCPLISPELHFIICFLIESQLHEGFWRNFLKLRNYCCLFRNKLNHSEQPNTS